ncbi:Ger(x)C family spore germination protein [Fictibacillus sp. BK138]|uniref:Ger(x)C family spore germination protein n=1 Tax=Fictibacillus sp. BK138 TaxID=2512121 RepID=UPI00102A6673|nr:Ger(x)C family spore germination protein [Fictibacillus sp. BK138]RZT23743.1 spore germination protein KC [Fictibacillus sp. BK138]
MKLKKIRLIPVIALILLLTGCWNSRELEDIGIAVAMGIDKADGQYVVTVQLVNPSSISARMGDSSRAPIVTYQEKGKTIFEAIRRLTKTAPRKTFYPHLKMLVIGEKLAREGFAKSLDLLARDPEFRSDFFVVVAKDQRADHVLNVLVPVEKIAAQNMYVKLKTSADVFAPTLALTFGDLLHDLTSPGKQPVITGIQLTGDPAEGEKMENLQQVNPKVRLKYTNIAVFNVDKLKGWLNEKESKGYNYVQNHVKSTIVTVPCFSNKKEHLSVELIDADTKLKTNSMSSQPEMSVSVKADANIAEVGCSIDLTKQDTIEKVEKLVEKDINNKIRSSIKAAQQKYKLDFLGFGEVVHRSEPKYWKRVKNNWDKEFVTIPIRSRVDVHIHKLGKRGNSYINELKE